MHVQFKFEAQGVKIHRARPSEVHGEGVPLLNASARVRTWDRSIFRYEYPLDPYT